MIQSENFHCVHFRLPYDWRSTFPYLGTYFLQSLSFYFWCRTFFVTLMLPIGLCWYSIAFISDLELSLFKLNLEISRAAGKFSNSNLIAYKQKLCEIICFRCNAEQLSVNIMLRNFQNIYMQYLVMF